jgi:hypothetical protein
MKDPKRLLAGDGTAFERALLGAMASERPSSDLHRKMRLGIGLIGLGAVAKAASASFNQLALAGVVVVGLVTGGAVIAKRESASRVAESVVAQGAARPARAENVAPVEPIPITALEASGALPAKAAAPEPVRRESKPLPVADIREEIRLLDEARAAVKNRASGRALRVLARYEQKFPRGQFRQEMQVLRMEALEQSGESTRAAALAKRFLAEHPNSPHVERVEHVRN